MHTLISFATQWGSKYGGINCFNTDFLSAFGVAYHLGAQIVCIVASATPEEIEEARNAHVSLVPLLYVRLPGVQNMLPIPWINRIGRPIGISMQTRGKGDFHSGCMKLRGDWSSNGPLNSGNRSGQA